MPLNPIQKSPKKGAVRRFGEAKDALIKGVTDGRTRKRHNCNALLGML